MRPECESEPVCASRGQYDRRGLTGLRILRPTNSSHRASLLHDVVHLAWPMPRNRTLGGLGSQLKAKEIDAMAPKSP